MKPQIENSTEKGVVLLRIRLRGFLRIREPKFGYKTSRRLRYYFVAVAEVFFLLQKRRKGSGLV